MLIPELSDLEKLKKVTITDALAGRSQTNVNQVCPLHRVTWRLCSPIDAFVYSYSDVIPFSTIIFCLCPS